MFAPIYIFIYLSWCSEERVENPDEHMDLSMISSNLVSNVEEEGDRKSAVDKREGRLSTLSCPEAWKTQSSPKCQNESVG